MWKDGAGGMKEDKAKFQTVSNNVSNLYRRTLQIKQVKQIIREGR